MFTTIRPRDLARIALSYATAHIGNGVECPVCRGQFGHFVTYGAPLRTGALCPRCRSLERHRQFALFLREHPDAVKDGMHILHFAPDPQIAGLLHNAGAIRYVSADLAPGRAMKVMDVTAIDMPDASVDVLICSHVLEHVPDDRKAMREIRRVLKPGGWALVEVPIFYGLAVTDEDPSITDEDERIRRFGQRDHVRKYGRDYIGRLHAAGLRVDAIVPTGATTPEGRQRYGVFNEPMHVCAVEGSHS